MPVRRYLPAFARRLLAVVIVHTAASGAGAKPPNILFCISDDQSFPHAGAYGTPWVKTPAFDRIAREGLLFQRAYTPNSKCSPSRAIILTGRNTWQLREAANHAGHYPAGLRTFMEALGANGYFTGFTGKGWAPGIAGTVDGKPRQLTGPGYQAAKATPPTPNILPNDYAANFAAFLQARPAGQPFCFWFGASEPHRAYAAGSGVKLGGKSPADIPRVPPYWPDNDTVRQDLLDYAFEIEHFDRHLGRMLEQLEAAGELANTLIVVTADNGMPFPRAKGSTYELSLHLPLAVMWPAGITKPGRQVQDLVSFIDFAPTFLEVAGLTPEKAGMEPVQGRSLGAIFRDTHAGRIEPGRERLLTGQERHDLGRPGDVGYPVRGLIADGYLYLHNFEPARWPMSDPIAGYLNTDGSPTKSLILAANRQGVNHWQWVLNFGRRPAEELYDLARDPDCMNNLAADRAHVARRDRMKDALFAELRAQGDPRMAGNGAVFDQYVYPADIRDFYHRRVRGEKVKAGWVNETDYEAPGFNPEQPILPQP